MAIFRHEEKIKHLKWLSALSMKVCDRTADPIWHGTASAEIVVVMERRSNQWFLITGHITCFHWHQLKKNTPNSIYFIWMGKSHSLAISLAMIRKISKVPKVNGSAMPIQWSASVSQWFKIQLMMLDKYNYMQNKLSTVYFLLLHLKNNYCFV